MLLESAASESPAARWGAVWIPLAIGGTLTLVLTPLVAVFADTQPPGPVWLVPGLGILLGAVTITFAVIARAKAAQA